MNQWWLYAVAAALLWFMATANAQQATPQQEQRAAQPAAPRGMVVPPPHTGPAPAPAPHPPGWSDCHYNQRHQQVCRTCRIQQGKVFCTQPRIIPPPPKPSVTPTPPPPRKP